MCGVRPHPLLAFNPKKVAANLDFRMTKQSFAKGAAKTIPVVGAVISGGLTFATFPAYGQALAETPGRPRAGQTLWCTKYH